MEVCYQTFNGDWRNSFIVNDIIGWFPTNTEEEKQKRYEECQKNMIAAACLTEEDTPESIVEFAELAIAAQADAIVIDYHMAYENSNFMDYDTFVEKAAKPIFDVMKSAGYENTKSYEFRLSFMRLSYAKTS